MADVHEPKIRSYNMSQIRGKDTKPELIVRRFLHTNGIRFRLHDKRYPGKPDIILPKCKTAIFVHGCFWHGHDNCHYFVIPKTRTQWWLDKINRNKDKDADNEARLLNLGWRIVIIWECQLKQYNLDETLNQLLISIHKK